MNKDNNNNWIELQKYSSSGKFIKMYNPPRKTQKTFRFGFSKEFSKKYLQNKKFIKAIYKKKENHICIGLIPFKEQEINTYSITNRTEECNGLCYVSLRKLRTILKIPDGVGHLQRFREYEIEEYKGKNVFILNFKIPETGEEMYVGE